MANPLNPDSSQRAKHGITRERWRVLWPDLLVGAALLVGCALTLIPLLATGMERSAMKALSTAQLSPAQILLRNRLDEIDQRYAAQLQTNSNPDQLAIARIRAYAAAYTAYLAQLEARP